jgi:hypothetical protein
VSYTPPGYERVPIGILLYLPDRDQLWMRFREDYSQIVGEDDDLAVLRLLAQDLADKAGQMGSKEVLTWLEDTLSNTLQISERMPVSDMTSSKTTLDHLFARIVGN